MKKSLIPLLNFLTLILILVSPSVLASETEDIWLYVFLIPIYFVLIALCLLVLFALLMKHFKTKKTVFLPFVMAGIFMLLGLGITYYLEPVEKLWPLLLHFSLIGIIVFTLPFIQYTLLKKTNNIPSESEG